MNYNNIDEDQLEKIIQDLLIKEEDKDPGFTILFINEESFESFMKDFDKAMKEYHKKMT